jgi:hypothetical protein
MYQRTVMYCCIVDSSVDSRSLLYVAYQSISVCRQSPLTQPSALSISLNVSLCSGSSHDGLSISRNSARRWGRLNDTIGYDVSGVIRRRTADNSGAASSSEPSSRANA